MLAEHSPRLALPSWRPWRPCAAASSVGELSRYLTTCCRFSAKKLLFLRVGAGIQLLHTLGSMKSTDDSGREVVKSDAAKLVWCVGGVVSTLIIYGVMQERIMKVPYGPEEELFKHSLFIVLCNRVLTCAVAIGIMLFQRKSMAPVAPLYSYAGVSLSNVVATTCQYEALKYVSFPLQTLAKSAKMIPVMIWGTAIMQKRYGLNDYFVASTVTGGCAVFLMAAGARKARKNVESTVWGVSLMLGYLGFDGFTSTFQDKLFKGYNMETFNQILYVTLCSSALSLIGLLSQGTLLLAIDFVLRHPQCLFDIMLLSFAATTSQFFISYTIRTFGALVFATIMTTRQLLSILLSSLIYGPPLNIAQLAGTVLVFGSLYYKAYAGGNKSRRSDAKSEVAKERERESEPLLEGTASGGTEMESAGSDKLSPHLHRGGEKLSPQMH